MNRFRDAITPMLLTYNEAPNIRRSLERLTWAARILVVDSFSRDETVAIVREFPQAVLVQRAFASFAEQCNFGLQQIDTPWVLSMDADYILTEGFLAELERLSPPDEIVGYAARFKYCVHGKPLRGALYPSRTVLYRQRGARYRNDGHGHRVEVDGTVSALKAYIYHDDRKSLQHWFHSQHGYALLEAQKLLSSPTESLGRVDRIRKAKLFAPVLAFAYCLFLKGGILDGWRGWHYALQRSLAETLLSLNLIEIELQRSADAPAPRRVYRRRRVDSLAD